MQVWQLLPLGPPDPMFFSPYSSTDANCGNPFMISTDELVKDGLLEQHEQPAQVSSEQGWARNQVCTCANRRGTSSGHQHPPQLSGAA